MQSLYRCGNLFSKREKHYAVITIYQTSSEAVTGYDTAIAQAIKLLQMSNIELSQHLQEQMYENPFLEVKTIDDRESEKAARNEPVSIIQLPLRLRVQAVIQKTGQDLLASEPQNDLSALKESEALKDDPTHSSEYENRFDTAHADTTIGKRSNAGGDGDFNLIENVSVEEVLSPAFPPA